MFKNLIPKIFYDHLQDGLAFFVEGLGFELLYQDAELAVVARDRAKAYLVEDPEYAAKARPELSIETENIDEIYQEMAARAPHFLHPHANQVVLKPWGAREFALLDKTTVAVIFREWPTNLRKD